MLLQLLILFVILSLVLSLVWYLPLPPSPPFLKQALMCIVLLCAIIWCFRNFAVTP